MDGSLLFPVVDNKSDSYGGVDSGSLILSSQSGDLISWGEDESPMNLSEARDESGPCRARVVLLIT